MKKPSILMVTDHACIRVIKEGIALLYKGYEVHLMARVDAFAFNLFTSFTKYVNEEHGTKVIQHYARFVDIVHCHNEPDEIVTMARNATDKPVIFDVHDLDSMRRDDVPTEKETKAFEAANAFVHVSEPCRKYAENLHGSDKPTIILHPYVNERWVPKPEKLIPDPCQHSLVYQGGLSMKPEISKYIPETGEHRTMANYRYLVPLADAFINAGYEMTIFAVTEVGLPIYHNLGVCVVDKVVYPLMLRGLRPHGLGFVGACDSFVLMESAMPNKLFEYISQGVIPLILCASEAAKYVQERECGIVLKSLKHVREQIEAHDMKKLRANVLKQIPELTMENNIEPLEKLYQEVL